MIGKLFKKATSYFAILIFAVNFHVSSARASSFSEVTDILSTLTCTTEGVHNLLMEPFTHSCIQDDFLTMLVSGMISGGIHTQFMMRLRMDDENILPGNCLRKNRANPNNPTISFGICADQFIGDPALGAGQLGKGMIAYRAELLGLAVYALVTGDNVWDEISKMVDSSKYTIMYNNRSDGDMGFFADIGSMIPWFVEERGDRICVSTIGATILAGNWLHVGCKYIEEPFPESVYSSFFRNTGLDPTTVPPEMVQYMNCATAGGCAARGQVYSQAAITISGTIMECIREMITKMMISSDVCVVGNFTSIGQISSVDSSFFQFQTNMQQAVMAFLTLYIMTIGLKVLMGGADNLPKSGELFMHIVKFMLVIYFSVGMNMGGLGPRFDGMVSFVFPILLSAGAEIATWVSNAVPNGLCRFLPSDYPTGMGYLALWDSLDCKVLHYIGIDALMTVWQGSNSGDPLGYSIPPYVYLLVPAIASKQIKLVILCITFPLLVLSLAAYLVNAFAVCLIAIAILGILAPVFVPMALFDITKGYFQAWYTLMISFVLQPVVVVGFMTLMFSLYDQGFYGTCKYIPLDLIKTGPTGETLTKKLFIIDNDMDNYESEAEYKACQESIGWILNNPLGSVAAQIADVTDGRTINMSSAPEEEKKMADYMRQFGALSGIGPVTGFFFGYYALFVNLSWKMIVNLLICCLLMYLMYELSEQLAKIAADLAQSVTLSGVIKPRAVADAAIKAIGAAAGSKGGDGAGKDGDGGPSMGKDGDGKGDGPAMGKREGGSSGPSMGGKKAASKPKYESPTMGGSSDA